MKKKNRRRGCALLFLWIPLPPPLCFKAGLYVIFDVFTRAVMWNFILFFPGLTNLDFESRSSLFFVAEARASLGASPRVEKYHEAWMTSDDHTIQYKEATSCRPDDFALLPLLFCIHVLIFRSSWC
ncbi:hypothetical protein F4813DRAFT_190039 [Daldinia decipiens]|uniref:uncharacterized protein n=1 Tax=Daldinia decipiens TaxID=326647 RepID=UPI0020C4CA8F|nr:uncharacterized protein F4813DRAFT_190039 [Daldinia decipiens]KAI1655108.1 hypothetical protein F4813DRAFT_190039 [Daldinia decipiens]